MAGIPDMVKLVADLATYEAAVAAGKTSPDVMYLILAEKKVFFQGEDWTQGGGSEVDTSTLATKAELEEVEEVAAAALNDLNERVNELSDNVAGETVTKEALTAEMERITNEIVNNEEVAAAALNDLNDRVNELSDNVAGETVTKEEFADAVAALNESLAGKADAASTTEALTSLEESVNTINESLAGYATTEALTDEMERITAEIVNNEEVAAAALNDLNERLMKIEEMLNNQ